MGGRAREVLHQVAEGLRRGSAKLDNHAAVRLDRGLVGSPRDDPLDGGVLAERLRELVRTDGRSSEVDVVNQLSAAPQSADDLDALHPGRGGEVARQELGDGQSPPDADPRPAQGLARPGELLGEHRLGLLAEPGHRAHAAVLDRGRELLQVGHAQLMPEGQRALRTDARERGDRREALRHAGLQLLEGGDAAGVRQLDDLRLEGGADVRQLDRRALPRELGHRSVGAADAARAAPIGQDAVADRALDLEQVGEQIERRRHLGVGRQARRHPVTIARTPRRPGGPLLVFPAGVRPSTTRRSR